jgi:hypothetical protein
VSFSDLVVTPAVTPPRQPPAKIPADAVPMNTQSRSELFTNWDRQIGCSDQYYPAAANIVWSEMLASEPVGSTWDPASAARRRRR